MDGHWIVEGMGLQTEFICLETGAKIYIAQENHLFKVRRSPGIPEIKDLFHIKGKKKAKEMVEKLRDFLKAKPLVELSD